MHTCTLVFIVDDEIMFDVCIIKYLERRIEELQIHNFQVNSNIKI